jgi:hypothetical protein
LDRNHASVNTQKKHDDSHIEEKKRENISKIKEGASRIYEESFLCGPDQYIENNNRTSNEWNEILYLMFIDFKKAFDSVSRDNIWKIRKIFVYHERF